MIRFIPAMLILIFLIGCAASDRGASIAEAPEAVTADASYSMRGMSPSKPAAKMAPMGTMAGKAAFASLAAAPPAENSASTPLPAPPPVNAGDVDPAKPGANRKIVYTANLGLRVPNKNNAAEAVRKVVEKHGGFVANSTLDDITFRVKPDQFDATIAELETLGEVITRNINSNDITEQYTDVELRLETATSSRQRLLALLEKATATKDVIEIERDIRRLTEEIETMKGRLRVLADQVDLATITVHLEEKFVDQTQSPRRTSTPYEWMLNTGIEMTLAALEPNPPMYRSSLFEEAEFTLKTEDKSPAPQGFVPLTMTPKLLVAGTPEDFRLRVRAFEVPKKQKANIDFWKDAITSELSNNRGYNVLSSDAVTLEDTDLEGVRLTTEVTYSGEKWSYDLWIIRDKKEPEEFVTVEFARLKSSEAEGSKKNYLDEVVKAVEGVRM